MSWSPVSEGAPPLPPAAPATPAAPPSPGLRPPPPPQASTPNYVAKKPQHPPLSVSVPSTAAPSTPPISSEQSRVTPPRSPGGVVSPAVSGDARNHPPDGTSSDKSSETAVAPRGAASSALSRKESYKAQRQHYRREKKRAATALLHSIEDPSVIVLADWLKVRGSLKSWTKLWCVLKPGLLLLYKSPKAKSSHWVGTVLLTSCQVIERPSKKDGFCFKLYHPLEQSIWAPRGPHNETIGAVVQPLPTAHLIFRAPSQAAGHCWLDGLELALRCSNAMLRCSHSRATEHSQPETPSAEPQISNEELEKHFNEHELAGAASDTDSTPEAETMALTNTKKDEARVHEVIEALEKFYTEDPDTDVGQAGELVEEVAEENKSLLWFLLKQVRPGMDLSKVVLPTFILEPRSFLDKLADTYYHADILAHAQTLEEPYARFLGVLRFYMSGFYRKPKGLKKPYNPVLGETFRCCWKHPATGNYTYYVSEQVSHHPPISAFYISNRKEGFVIEGSLLAKSKFYGNSTSAILDGCARIYLLNWNEVYVTTAPYAHCKGIIMGTLSMELGGKINIKCAQTGYSAEIEFKLRPFLGSSEQTNILNGKIKKDNNTIATIDGHWDGRIDIKEKKGGKQSEATLIDVGTLKTQRLTRYLVRLEEQAPFESQKLWVKVSEAIAREDQVAATKEKTVIEEEQRARAKNATLPWQPRYFHRDHERKFSDGLPDQGWSYNYENTSQWNQNELYEFETDYVIQSVLSSTLTQPLPRTSGSALSRLSGAGMGRASVSGVRGMSGTTLSESRKLSERRQLSDARRLTDTDSAEDFTVGKKGRKSLKRSLEQIESALRANTIALDQLQRQVHEINAENSHSRAQMRRSNRPSNSTSSRDETAFTSSPLFHALVGFIVALLMQALFSKII